MLNSIVHIQNNNEPRKRHISMFAKCRGFLFIAVIIAIAGCTHTTSNTTGTSKNNTLPNMPVLVLLPVSSNDGIKDIDKTKLHKAFVNGLTQTEGFNVVSSKNSQVLKNAATAENLIRKGSFAIKELQAISKTTDCPSVLAWDVSQIAPYGPQNISLRMIFLETSTGKVKAKQYFDINLADSNTKREYKKFLGQKLHQKIRNTFSRNSSRDKSVSHVDIFSNQKFWQFAGYIVAQNVRKKLLHQQSVKE